MNRRKAWIFGLLALLLVFLMAACAAPEEQPADEVDEPDAAEDEGDELEEESEPEPTNLPEPTATELPATEAPTPIPPPEPTATLEPEEQIAALGAATEEDIALYDQLKAVIIPDANPIELSIALEGVNRDDIPELPTEGDDYSLGDIQIFFVHNQDTSAIVEVEAKLTFISRHGYFWQDTGVQAVNATDSPVTPGDWKAAGDAFDSAYESVIEVFGQERSPGIDGDLKLHILHSSQLGSGIAGYVGSTDILPTVVEEKSNQKEIFYMQSGESSVGVAGAQYNSTLAHEFQHLIHTYRDESEDGWLNEGLSELAVKIAQGSDSDWIAQYTADIDNSLYYWSGGGDYGYGYLWTVYLYEQFGTDFITDLVFNPLDGFNGIDDTLASTGANMTVEDVYSDFMLAVYFNDQALLGPKYGYVDVNTGKVPPTAGFRDFPQNVVDTVNQFGFDVFRFRGEGPATVTFTGAATTTLIPADAHSGSKVWWSNRTDTGFSTLTHEVDLSGTDTATLTYWSWYNIETDWDYAYVLVSADGGETWETQESTGSRDTDPNAANFGNGITGRSGGGRTPVWAQETVDLSAYAGQTILLRFAMFTDAVFNEENMAIDDVEIAEVGFADDMESGDNGWVADGWVQSHNRVPQVWSLRVVFEDANGRLTLQDIEVVDGVASFSLNFDTINVISVFVSAQTRFTTTLAPFTIDVLPAE